jgi:hypothetical protein
MMSHPVTVTVCDTGVTPSRHIRPPIRGGVYVTGAQQCGEGLRDLLIGTNVLISEISSRVDRTSFRQGVISGLKINRLAIDIADTVQTRDHAFSQCSAIKAVSYADSVIDNHVRGIYARALSRPLTLLEADARARSSQAKRQGWAQPLEAFGSNVPGGMGGGGENPRARNRRPPCNLSRPALPNPCHQCVRR